MATGINRRERVLNAGNSIDRTPHRTLYDEIQLDFPVPLEQAWSYGDAIAATSCNRISRAIIEIGGLPAATAQAAERSLPRGLTSVRLTRGLSVPHPAHLTMVLNGLRAHWPRTRGRLLFLMPDVSQEDARPLLRAIGKRPMTSGYTTAWLDLRPDADELLQAMRRNWRGALNKGRAEAPTVRVSWRKADIEEFVSTYLQDRRRNRYSGPPARFVRALSEAFGRDMQLFRAFERGEAVAAALFIRHGRSSTYYLSWTTDRGREINAAHVLLWEAISTLRNAGIRWLDLGGIDAHAAGLARFKLGFGAPPVTYSGTWL